MELEESPAWTLERVTEANEALDATAEAEGELALQQQRDAERQARRPDGRR